MSHNRQRKGPFTLGHINFPIDCLAVYLQTSDLCLEHRVISPNPAGMGRRGLGPAEKDCRQCPYDYIQ